MIAISAAICRDKEGRILICKRGPGGSCAFLWEFPGGKVEPGESHEACLVRECMEELGITIAVGPCVAEATHSYPDRSVYIRFYEAAVLGGEPQLTVHEAMLWVDPRELGSFEFCPADRDIVHKLMQA